MDKWKATCRRLLTPPVWLILVLAVGCTGALIAVFWKGWDRSPVAIAVYVLAFYTLTVCCFACAQVFPRWYRSLKERFSATRFGGRYLTDVAFKTHVSLYRSLGVNLLYVAVNLVSGLWFRSTWFVVLAAYYSILAIMRFLLLRYARRNPIGQRRRAELRRARLCAAILLTVNLALTGAVLMILYQGHGFQYPGMLIYVMAMYAFYSTTSAIVNLARYRKYNSPVMSTAKTVNLAAALVSMLSLETAMLTQFGADTAPEFRNLMIAATGGGISLLVLGLSAYTICKSSLELARTAESDNRRQ